MFKLAIIATAAAFSVISIGCHPVVVYVEGDHELRSSEYEEQAYYEPRRERRSANFNNPSPNWSHAYAVQRFGYDSRQARSIRKAYARKSPKRSRRFFSRGR